MMLCSRRRVVRTCALPQSNTRILSVLLRHPIAGGRKVQIRITDSQPTCCISLILSLILPPNPHFNVYEIGRNLIAVLGYSLIVSLLSYWYVFTSYILLGCLKIMPS